MSGICGCCGEILGGSRVNRNRIVATTVIDTVAHPDGVPISDAAPAMISPAVTGISPTGISPTGISPT
jgi:hypothetical protein